MPPNSNQDLLQYPSDQNTMANFDSYQRSTQTNGTKRQWSEKKPRDRPQKKIKALFEDDSASDEDAGSSSLGGGVLVKEESTPPVGHGFTVNDMYARRFKHNKEREELQRLEEKYPGRGPELKAEEEKSNSSSDSEEEDDDGILASEVLDAQIQATLQAIRRKDPRVYDEKVTFYTELDEEESKGAKRDINKEKPMYLSDYHRENLLAEANGTDAPEDGPTTYAQQQEDLKNLIVKEMHAATNGNRDSDDANDSDQESVDGFLVRKASRKQDDANYKKANRKLQVTDVEAADQDPETYLSNFMSARAWVPSDGALFQPFESDDDEEDHRAELFEEAYNMRFEDPKVSNEKLMSHARDAAAKYSVRKEDMNPRRKAREAERAKKDAAKKVREEEKTRLRTLKVAEAEEKIKKIKNAAGLRDKSVQEKDWSSFLEEGWDDERWEQEMKKRFGDDYYADYDVEESGEQEGGGKRKIRKPKWEDDIHIGDLASDFDEGEDEKPRYSLTDDELITGGASPQESHDGDSFDGVPRKLPQTKEKSNRKREREEQKRETRQERRKIERHVDRQLNVDSTLSNFGKKHAGHFRYRETSPTAFGLTANDILMASDSQLNQYAGLKKMAAFRDLDKKRKDKKRLGKKARLRQWRKETFGDEQGPQKTLVDVLAGQALTGSNIHSKATDSTNIIEGKKKKARSRKAK